MDNTCHQVLKVTGMSLGGGAESGCGLVQVWMSPGVDMYGNSTLERHYQIFSNQDTVNSLQGSKTETDAV